MNMVKTAMRNRELVKRGFDMPLNFGSLTRDACFSPISHLFL